MLGSVGILIIFAWPAFLFSSLDNSFPLVKLPLPCSNHGSALPQAGGGGGAAGICPNQGQSEFSLSIGMDPEKGRVSVPLG